MPQETAGIESVELEKACRAFSCPQVPLDEGLFESVIVEYAAGVTGAFLDRFRQMLDGNGPGISSLLDRIQSGEADSRAVWCSALGDCFEAVKRDDKGAAVSSAVALALRLGSYGIAGDWGARLVGPTTLLWDRWVIPTCTQLSVTSDGRCSEVTTFMYGERRLTKLEYSSTWIAEGTEEIQSVLGHGRRLLILPVGLLGASKFDGLRESAIPETNGDSILPLLTTLEGLEEKLPIYHQWVMRVISEMFITHAPERLVSGSIQGQPGLVHISNSSTPDSIAEMLIHEASHQYYHLLSRLGPIDDGSDQELYFNPFVAALRPLARIVLAYHAFANVWLYYKLSLATGFGQPDRCVRQMNEVMKDLRVLRKVVEGNPALTSWGRAIVEPLLELTACPD